jgi:hypothetical protein
VSGYSDGRKLEYAALASLKADGYWVIRAAGSKGIADLIALKPPEDDGPVGEVVFVQCKLTGILSPDERMALWSLGRRFWGVPLCARWVKDGRAARTVEFRQLTGPGPKDWQPWTADHALEEAF